jgi:hypothetical protein
VTPRDEYLALPLTAHALLADAPLHDVHALDLPGGGEGRTLSDLRALLADRTVMKANPAVAALFRLRWWLGRVFGWDQGGPDPAAWSYLSRVPEEVRQRSRTTPGIPDGPFTLLYLLDQESVSEVRNRTVHAFLVAAMVPRPGGYRLFWAVYVRATSWLTPVYMRAIDPFRRWIVYPGMLRALHRAWVRRYSS